MLVHGPRVELTDEEAVLVATLEPESSRVEPATLRLGVAREYREWLDESGTPLVPISTVLASAIGEDVRLEAPVSSRLVTGAHQVTRKFEGWWGYRAVRIDAPEAAPPSGPEVGAMFSRGIDTTATLLRSLRGEIPQRTTHLLSLYGAEWKFSAATHEAIWHDNVEAAAEYGLPLIRLTTNAPHILRGRIGWPRSHGAVFASLALALGLRFSSVLFGSSQRPEHRRGHGSRWDLDPLWSTEATAIHHDAAELGKLGRAAIVATDPIALRHLKVCWAVDGPGNCGRCEKCLRTMTCLQIAGALDRTDRFDAPLTIEAIRACELTANSTTLVSEIVDHLPDEHADLREAWRAKLETRRAEERAQRRRRRLRPVRRARRRIVRRLPGRSRRRR
jgi:hypothetical protein